MLAVEVMSATVQAIFYGVAVVAFVIAAFRGPLFGQAAGRIVAWGVDLVALGLAAFAFVSFWNALALAN